MRTIGTVSILAALWLLMSGLFKPLLLVFGAMSVALTVVVLVRMDRTDGDRIALPVHPIRLAKYVCWLFIEIFKSCWSGTRLVLARDVSLRQHLFRVPCTQSSDIAQVMFANSITLTPGTITVETEQDTFLVHALDFSDTDIEALADMDRRVSAVETAVA